MGSYLYRPVSGPPPPAALIILHGHGGCATDLNRTARYFCDAGYLVLTQSLRGHLGTEAEGDQGLYEVEDLKCAVAWLMDHAAIAASRIGLLGFSHGGQNVLCAGCRGARVGAIAACYPPTDMASWMAARPEIAEFMADIIEPERLAERSALTMAAALEPPVLLIHGTEDRHVAYADTVRFKRVKAISFPMRRGNAPCSRWPSSTSAICARTPGQEPLPRRPGARMFWGAPL